MSDQKSSRSQLSIKGVVEVGGKRIKREVVLQLPIYRDREREAMFEGREREREVLWRERRLQTMKDSELR